jgi:hypothetical protein
MRRSSFGRLGRQAAQKTDALKGEAADAALSEADFARYAWYVSYQSRHRL